MEEEYEGVEADTFRKSIAKRILLDSDRLVDELFSIAYDMDVEPKVRLSAISMLIDRGIPKLGIQHSKEEESEEKGSRKQIREEIEKLMLGDDDDGDEDDGLAGSLV